MRLQSYTRMDTGVAVIELEGTIVHGEGAALLRGSILQALDHGHKKVLLDLEGVSYIDSAGLGELVSCNAIANARGAVLKLLHLQKKVEGLLQMTRLLTIFPAFEDEREAIRSFSQATSAQA